MKALSRRLSHQTRLVIQMATKTCAVSEGFATLCTPAYLEQCQTALRGQLLAVESNIREWDSRSSTRRARLKRFRQRYGASPLIGEHLALCDAYREMGRDGRRMPRERIADLSHRTGIHALTNSVVAIWAGADVGRPTVSAISTTALVSAVS